MSSILFVYRVTHNQKKIFINFQYIKIVLWKFALFSFLIENSRLKVLLVLFCIFSVRIQIWNKVRFKKNLITFSFYVWPNFDTLHQMLARFIKFWHASSNVDKLYQILTRFIKFWHALSYFDTLYQILTRFIKCWHTLSNFDTLYQMLTSFIIFWHALSNFDTLYQILTRFIKCWHALSNVDTLYQMLTRFIKFWHALSNFDTKRTNEPSYNRSLSTKQITVRNIKKTLMVPLNLTFYQFEVKKIFSHGLKPIYLKLWYKKWIYLNNRNAV